MKTTEFRQRKYSYRTEFGFSEDKFRYKIKDRLGSREFYVPYEALILDDLPSFSEKNPGYFKLLYILPFLCFIAAVASGSSKPMMDFFVAACAYSAFSIAGLQLFAVALLEVQFTTLPISAGIPGSGGQYPRIIYNKQHDEILDTLKEYWRKRMKVLLGKVNPNNNPDTEVAKMNWLLKNGVISEFEHRDAIDAIRPSGAIEPSGTTTSIN